MSPATAMARTARRRFTTAGREQYGTGPREEAVTCPGHPAEGNDDEPDDGQLQDHLTSAIITLLANTQRRWLRAAQVSESWRASASAAAAAVALGHTREGRRWVPTTMAIPAARARIPA